MPNAEDLAKLKEGVEAWNEWRRQHPQVVPDLSGADLSEANLVGADLSRANLSGANLSDATLSRANLREADLSEANLTGANAAHVDLSGANLTQTNLTGADLTGTDLAGTDMNESHRFGGWPDGVRELWSFYPMGSKRGSGRGCYVLGVIIVVLALVGWVLLRWFVRHA